MNRISRLNERLQAKIESLLARRQLKMFMKKTAFGMSCVAVFCVVYALVAPALTVEWPPKCGLEEHIHTEECYGTVTPVEMNCTVSASDADIIIHEHDDMCYDESGKLICEFTEVLAHEHDETCYVFVPTVDLDGMTEGNKADGNTENENNADADGAENDSATDSSSNTETDNEGTQGADKTDSAEPEINAAEQKADENADTQNAPEPETKTPEKSDTEKPDVSESHDEAARMPRQVLIASKDDMLPVSDKPVCGMEEVVLHEHTKACYGTDGKLTCGKLHVIAHQHTDECRITGEPQPGYICGFTEHRHTDLCWLNKQPEYFCGLEEHTHTASCFDENGEAVCGKMQHAHTEICETKPGEMNIDETYVYETETITVTFNISGAAILPGGTEFADDAALEFKASEIEDEDEIMAYAEEISEDGAVVAAQIFEYALFYGGRELDLSKCEVTAEITPTESLIEYSQSVDALGIMTLDIKDGEGSVDGDVIEKNPAELGLMLLAGDAEGESEEGIINEESAMTLKLRSNKVRVGIIETANPKFTVQYYAPLQRISTDAADGGKAIKVIDTDNGGAGAGGNLPKNGNNNLPEKKIYAGTSGMAAGESGKVVTKSEMTQIYASKEFTYLKAPNLKYFNIVTRDTLDSAYELEYIWVLKEGRDPESINENDWDRYEYGSDLKFTNRPESVVNSRYVLIEEDSVIRLVYNTIETKYGNPASFYDYDISDGFIYGATKNGDNYTINNADKRNTSSQKNSDVVFAKTNRQGINNAANYTESGAKLGFGNSNSTSGSGMESERWKGNALNTSNLNIGKSYLGCTFEIASKKMNVSDSTINYNTGISAPKLFNEAGDVIGKTSYMNEYNLEFNRVGDSYTLSGVKKGENTVIDNLETLTYRGQNWSKTADLWTNNFWPMDNAPSYGTDGHDLKFGDTSFTDNRKYNGAVNGTFATSDDGKDHNAYFGMQFAVQFEMTKDYVGPLEYYFFGDDDMWVYLNDTLVCDIGGIHTATGEYVNLWDYIDKSELEALGDEETKTYTLTFFYTERGASGSTCWMNFTLPTVVGVNLEKQLEDLNDSEHGALWIEKIVDGIVDPDAEFEFKLDLFTLDDNGNEVPLDDNYGGEILKRDETGAIIKGDENDIIHSGGTFRLKNGGAMVIYNLPAQIGEGEDAKQVYYRVQETASVGYYATHSVTEEVLSSAENLPNAGNGDNAENAQGETFNGEISANILDKVVYTNHAAYELPNTGAGGTQMYTIGGLFAIGIAASFMYRRKLLQKEREAD